ncbi:MAG: uroporphyrinogen decarboxylase family protein, partial [Armatimonadota bacterium]
MELLTVGERAVRCLNGEPIDRVPFGMGLGWAPWGEALQRWRVESGKPELNPGAELGFEGSFAAPSLHCGILPEFEAKVLEETENFVVVRDGRGVTQRCRKDGESIPEYLDYPVKTPDDWERLKTERLRLDTSNRVLQDWDAFRAHIAATGEAVQVGSFPWGVFGSVRDLMGVEELLVAFYDYPDMVRDMMEHLTSLWISLWKKTAAEVQIDHIHIWEDMSGRQGSLISPTMVREFMMPCYDKIVEFGRSAGVRVISVDTDGDCSQLVPVMMEHG